MNAQTLVLNVKTALAQGVQVAIEMPREGFWVDPSDKIEVRDGALYWEHANGRTYFVPAELCWLQCLPGGATR